MRISMIMKVFVAISGTLAVLILLGALIERHAMPLLIALLSKNMRDLLSKTLFYVAGQPVRVWFIIKATLYLLALALLSRLARYLVRISTRHSPSFGEHRQYVLSRTISFFIYAVGLLVGIHVERIQSGTLIVLGSTLGVGIGFALHPLFGNLIAGLILFIEQPIRISDVVEFGSKSGEVVKIGARCSWIRTSENALLIIPNSEFTSKDILNWTASDPRIRLSIPVSVGYGTDVPKVTHLLLQLASRHIDVLEDPAPEVILTELSQNAISFALRVWTIRGVDDFARLRSAVYLDIVRTFAAEEIMLPTPQLEVHYKKGTRCF
jgi:small-conductance mechanosensitive channel